MREQYIPETVNLSTTPLCPNEGKQLMFRACARNDVCDDTYKKPCMNPLFHKASCEP